METKYITSFGLGIAFTLVIMAFSYFLFNQPKIVTTVTEKSPNDAYLDVISHTEYYANESGQVIVRISDYLGNPLNATCNATIIYPDKSVWLLDQAMSSSSIAGNYYLTVTIPNVLGVYEYSFDCDVNLYGKPYSLKKSSSFFVSIAYQKFQEILDKLDALNSTFYNQTGAMNSTIMNKLYKIQDEITSVNDTVKATNSSITDLIYNLNSTMNTRFDNLEADIQIKYDNIINAIYNLQQKWLDMGTTLVNDLTGTGQSLNAIGDSLGISPNPNCGIWDRMVGNC